MRTALLFSILTASVLAQFGSGNLSGNDILSDNCISILDGAGSNSANGRDGSLNNNLKKRTCVGYSPSKPSHPHEPAHPVKPSPAPHKPSPPHEPAHPSKPKPSKPCGCKKGHPHHHGDGPAHPHKPSTPHQPAKAPHKPSAPHQPSTGKKPHHWTPSSCKAAGGVLSGNLDCNSLLDGNTISIGDGLGAGSLNGLGMGSLDGSGNGNGRFVLKKRSLDRQ